MATPVTLLLDIHLDHLRSRYATHHFQDLSLRNSLLVLAARRLHDMPRMVLRVWEIEDSRAADLWAGRVPAAGK